MRKYGHCNSLDFYKKSILNHFTWPSTDGNIWRHLDDYSVIKKKGKDLVDFVAIIPSDKEEYEAVGYLNPSPRSRSDFEISPIGIKFNVFLYSVDFGIEKTDPNRGLWIQGKEDGAWYRLCNPSEEYRTIHELNSLKTKTFLDLYDFVRNNEEDFDDMSDAEYLYCNLTMDQFIAKLKSKDYNTSFLQEFRAFYYRNFDTTFSPNCPFMKSFKSYVDNSSQNLLNPAINISDNSLANTSNRKRKYVLDDDDDDDKEDEKTTENPVTTTSSDTTNITELITAESTMINHNDLTPINDTTIAFDSEVIDQMSPPSSPTTPLQSTYSIKLTATKNVNKSTNENEPNTPSKNKKAEVSAKKRAKPTKSKESPGNTKKSLPSNKRDSNTSPTSMDLSNNLNLSEDSNILQNYRVGSRVYAKEENARHFNFGVIVGESEDKKYFNVKWDINMRISEIPKIPSCFEEFENKRKSIQTEKFVPNFTSDKGNRIKKDSTPVIIIDDEDENDDDDYKSKESVAATPKRKKTSRNEKKNDSKLSTTTTGKRKSRKRTVLPNTTTKKNEKSTKKKPRTRKRRNSTDSGTGVEDSEDELMDSSDDDSTDDDDKDDDDANYEEGMEVEENEPQDVPERNIIQVQEDNSISIKEVPPDHPIPIPVKSRRASDSALLSTTSSSSSSSASRLSKPSRQRHHSDSVEQSSSSHERIHSSSYGRKGIQDEFSAILNKQREKGEFTFTSAASASAVPSPRSAEPNDIVSGSSSTTFNIRNSSADLAPSAVPKKPLNNTSKTTASSLIESISKTINNYSSNIKTAEGKSDKEDSRFDCKSGMKGSKSSSSIRPDWSIALDQKKKERLAVTSDRMSRQDIPPNMIPVGIRDDYTTITRTMPAGPTMSASSTLSTRVNEMRDLSKASTLIATADSKTTMRNSSSIISTGNNRSGERKEQKDRPFPTLLTSAVSTLDRIKKKGILLTPSSTNSNSASNFNSFNSSTVDISSDNTALDQFNDEDDAPRKSKGVRFADDNGGRLSTRSTYYPATSNDAVTADSYSHSASSASIQRSSSLDSEGSNNHHTSTVVNNSDDNKSSSTNNYLSSNLLQAKETANHGSSSIVDSKPIANNAAIKQVNSDSWGSGWGDDVEEIETPLPAAVIKKGNSSNNHFTFNPVHHHQGHNQPPPVVTIATKEHKTKEAVLVEEKGWGSGWGDESGKEVAVVNKDNLNRENRESLSSKSDKNSTEQPLPLLNKHEIKQVVDDGWGSGWGDAEEVNAPQSTKNVALNNDIYKPVNQRNSHQPPKNKLETVKKSDDVGWGSGWGDDDTVVANIPTTTNNSSSTNKDQNKSPNNRDISNDTNTNHHHDNNTSGNWGSGRGDSNTAKSSDAFASTKNNQQYRRNDSSTSNYSNQNFPRDRSRSSSSDTQQRTGTNWNNNNRNSQQTIARMGGSTETISRSNSSSSNQKQVSPSSGNNLTSSSMVQNKSNVTKSDDSTSESWGGGW